MNGAQLVVTLLKKNNVDVIFGYPGGAIMPVYDALFDCGIEHLLCRHEQAAVFSAIGYARATGKVGVCCATSGPGATNLITGLADALLDSVPIVAITGQVGSNFIGTDAFQEVDVLGLSLACTKHSFLVESLSVLPHIVNQAFVIASSKRPGPVLVDIPKDIQLLTSSVVVDSLNSKKSVVSSDDNSKIESNLKTANLLISQSHRPVLYVGGGVAISGSITKLRDFVRITGIPVVATLKGLGSPDYRDPCYLGMLGMHGNQAANLVVQRCDLLIAVGARFDDRVTGKVSAFAPKAKVIHLDIDSSEFNKLRKADVILLGDLNYSLAALTQSLSLENWRAEVKKLRNKYRWYYNYSVSKKISAPILLKRINDIVSGNSIITTDVGQHQMWAAQHMQFDSPKNFISSSGLGSMGFGIPAAIGAQIGRPYSTVVCISGDGSFMMNVQELGTIKRKKLPIKIVLLDNKRLGMVRQWQELFFNKRYCETSLTDNPDFIMLAQSFGISALSICYESQITNAIKKLFSHSGPFLLHVVINEFDNVWPLVPPGSSNDVMLDGAIVI